MPVPYLLFDDTISILLNTECWARQSNLPYYYYGLFDLVTFSLR
jgi:hypothetical protein